MKKLIAISCILALMSCTTEEKKSSDPSSAAKGTTLEGKEDNGYTYEYVAGDPLETRIYTLENGLKVYLSQNKAKPRIMTLIPVKAGSTYDPKETTGLAHYLEHMMFKGTDRMGTIDFEKEKVLLDAISEKFEEHKNESDPSQKKAIYAQIDSLSYEASKYAVPNEYDKMISSLGAKSTNAFTSHEQTVYMNDIPTTGLEKWLKLESERFSKLVLRLFHTELETVYEEFNMGQDNDFRKVYAQMNKMLYPNHPYGTQTTIGEGEHLKNPSLVNIHAYHDKYYVPNNMAICLSGDLDYAQTIALIDKYFGKFEKSEDLQHPKIGEPEPIKGATEAEVFGPEAESLTMAFRVGGSGTEDEKLAAITTGILSNNQAGLLDLDLVNQQKVLSASCYPNHLNHAGAIMFSAQNRDGQTLEEVKDLLWEEIEKLKAGQFDDWLVQAVVNDYQLSKIRSYEGNNRVFELLDAFTANRNRADQVMMLDELDKYTKDDIIAFAKRVFADDYITIYKRTGQDDNTMKVEKPMITPVQLNRDTASPFFAEFQAVPSTPLQPDFINFDETIQKTTLASGIPLHYVKNETNELFQVNYILDLGKAHDKEMAMAVQYLKYVGTSKYTSDELNKEFYKLGVSFGVYAGDDRTYVYMSGLEKSADKAIELLEHIIQEAKADPEAYKKFAMGILRKRENQKKNKSYASYLAIPNYAKYGKVNPFNDVIPQEELMSLDPNQLIDKVKGLTEYEHRVFYYGQRDLETVKTALSKLHNVPEALQPLPEKKEYAVVETTGDRIFVIDHDMVQIDVNLVCNRQPFDKGILAEANVFNEYFGSGLSSIVFQEIREAKGLAYSSYAVYTSPSKEDGIHAMRVFVGTQSDKFSDALKEMLRLLSDMPKAEAQFSSAKESIIKKYNSQRYVGREIYTRYMKLQDLGFNYEINKELYDEVQNMTIEDLDTFFKENIRSQPLDMFVMGKKSEMDMEKLKEFGTVTVLTKEELFGY